jgi:hypothetical protein
MRENGTKKQIREMVRDIKYGQMVVCTKGIGDMIKLMVGED